MGDGVASGVGVSVGQGVGVSVGTGVAVAATKLEGCTAVDELWLLNRTNAIRPQIIITPAVAALTSMTSRLRFC